MYRDPQDSIFISISLFVSSYHELLNSLLPVGELAEDLVHARVLLTLLVNDLLDECVLIAHLLQVLPSGLRLDFRLEVV